MSGGKVPEHDVLFLLCESGWFAAFNNFKDLWEIFATNLHVGFAFCAKFFGKLFAWAFHDLKFVKTVSVVENIRFFNVSNFFRWGEACICECNVGCRFTALHTSATSGGVLLLDRHNNHSFVLRGENVRKILNEKTANTVSSYNFEILRMIALRKRFYRTRDSSRCFN